MLKLGPREMAQKLRLLAILEKNLGSIPSNHIVTRNHPQLQFQVIWCPLLTSAGPEIHVASIHAHKKNAHTHKINPLQEQVLFTTRPSSSSTPLPFSIYLHSISIFYKFYSFWSKPIWHSFEFNGTKSYNTKALGKHSVQDREQKW